MNDWYYPHDNLSYNPQNDTVNETPLTTQPNLYHLPPFPIAPIDTYRDRMSYERDMRYLMSLYPDFLRPLLDIIKATVDQHDRPGSFLYDSFPDKERILRLVFEIYDQMAQTVGDTTFFPQYPMTGDTVGTLEGDTLIQENPAIRFTTNPRNLWLVSLIQILLSNEILYRRRNNQERRRYWYGY